MPPRIQIAPGSVSLFGHPLPPLRQAEAFRTALGPPSRSRDIKMHPGGIRIAMVWDALGLVAYEDQPDGTMSHLHVAFDPDETPERPLHSSQSIIHVNGTEVTADTTERALPRLQQASAGGTLMNVSDLSWIFTLKSAATPGAAKRARGGWPPCPFSWRQPAGGRP